MISIWLLYEWHLDGSPILHEIIDGDKAEEFVQSKVGHWWSYEKWDRDAQGSWGKVLDVWVDTRSESHYNYRALGNT